MTCQGPVWVDLAALIAVVESEGFGGRLDLDDAWAAKLHAILSG